MSRALNIDATQDEVVAACAKNDAKISVIETLPGGCTRVVLRTGDGAAIIQRHFAKKILTKPMARTPLSIAARGVPLTETARSAPTPGTFAPSKSRRV